MPITTAAAYNEGVERLLKAGYDQPEARVAAGAVLDSVMGARHVHLLQPDAALAESAGAEMQDCFRQLEGGLPLRYLLKECEFFGYPFVCDERALIPRADTETLVEAALGRLGRERAVRVADLGTGTGCIAISLALSLPAARIYATDASDSALALCGENVSLNKVAERVTLVRGARGDWSGPLLQLGLGGSFDAVLTNPPYIESSEIETLQRQIREHEPRAALDGGEDGLSCYREIAAQCGSLLAPDGFLMAELGAGQFGPVRRIFEEAGWKVESPVMDLGRIERVLVATR